MDIISLTTEPNFIDRITVAEARRMFAGSDLVMQGIDLIVSGQHKRVNVEVGPGAMIHLRALNNEG